MRQILQFANKQCLLPAAGRLIQVSSECFCVFTTASFIVFSYVVLHARFIWLLRFGCQYQCKLLTGKNRLQNDLKCVVGDVKPYSFASLQNQRLLADDFIRKITKSLFVHFILQFCSRLKSRNNRTSN